MGRGLQADDRNSPDGTSAAPAAPVARDDQGFFKAVQEGDAATVARLLAAGHDANAVDPYGLSALNYAANSGSVTSLKALLASGAKVNYADPWGMTSLHAALKEGHDEAATLLIEAGADVNARTKSGYFPGFSPLHAAVYFAKAGLPVVRLLLERGADRSAKDARGRTALDMARAGGDARMTALLEDGIRANGP